MNHKVISRMTKMGVTVFVLLSVTPVTANEIDELKEQVKVLTQKVESLEKKQRQDAKKPGAKETHGSGSSSNVVTADDVPGSFKLPGTNTSMKIGGFIETSFIYDIGPRPTSRGGDIASAHTAILEGTPEYEKRGDSRITARNSRFNISTFTPTEYGQIRTFIEADFNGPPNDKASRSTSNRYSLGIRHAYLRVGRFLVGQTWSNLMDKSTFPNKVDGTGPTGRTFIRQGQIRYMQRLTDRQSFAVALENPKGDFEGADDATLDDNVPDLTAHYRYETDRWHLQVGGLLRRIAIDDGLADGAKDSVTAWGLKQSGSFMLPGSIDRISWSATFGNGLGRYLESGIDQGATLDANGKLDTQFAYGGFLTYQHWWTGTLQSNIDFGVSIHELNPDAVADANKRILSSHLNLIWLPIDRLELGMEYVWGHRQVHDDREGQIDRIQCHAVYYF